MHHTLRTTHYVSPIPWLLFLLALLPRLPGLGRFLTSDENTNIFFAGSDVIAAFMKGDWRGTYWHFYPGVTMSWLDAIGMGGQYLWEWGRGNPVPAFTDYIYGDILGLVVATRLPYAFLTAATIPLLYLLARRLLPEPVALLGSLFLAFDPFFLAHSRVVHGDAPVAVFMCLSALSLFIYGQQAVELTRFSSSIRHPSFFYLMVSAGAGGLAALTKAPGQFMALFVVGMAGLYSSLEWWQARREPGPASRPFSTIAFKWMGVVGLWGLISLVVFVLLWPAMWVDPVGTLGRMWAETFGKVNEGHLVYFFGRPTLDPGPWFYPCVIPFRLTPVTLIGLFLSLFLFLPPLKLYLAGSQTSSPPRLSASSLLWLFVISLLLFGMLSPKKQDRYLLPLFPFLDLLAAAGWYGLVAGLILPRILPWFQNSSFRQSSPRPEPVEGPVEGLTPVSFDRLRRRPGTGMAALTSLVLAGLLLLHSIPVFSYYPYYLAYFNPILGGPAQAARTTLMGWGEGMEQAAAYLNTKLEAERLYVASTPSQTLLPYFAGTGENFYTNDIAFRADYVVIYLAQQQRLAPSPEIVRYFEAQPPEKVITVLDIPYAHIYPGPKLILADIPPEATPANIGLEGVLRLAGYRYRPGAGDQKPELTLYWHALAPLAANYTISVRARTAEGRLLVQQDQEPVNGLLPTGQWRQGDYVADAHLLALPPAEATQIDHFEVVVYEAATGETLDPPITLTPGSS